MQNETSVKQLTLPYDEPLNLFERREVEKEYDSDDYDFRIERSWITGLTKY